MKKVQVRIEDRELTLSNLDKVFWPDKNVVKGELINYYREVAPLPPAPSERPALNHEPFSRRYHGEKFLSKGLPGIRPGLGDHRPGSFRGKIRGKESH
jgi:bifunctional non-homologous end joining protein LigD